MGASPFGRSGSSLTADGEELARYYANENRTWVPLSEISEHAVHALIATEDRDFYAHGGVAGGPHIHPYWGWSGTEE